MIKTLLRPEESTAYSNNLLSLLCSNESEHQPKPKEVAKPVHAHSEKSNQLTSSLEKKILNGQFLHHFSFSLFFARVFVCLGWYSSLYNHFFATAVEIGE